MWLKYLSSLQNDELNQLHLLRDFPEECPDSLVEFIRRSRQMSLLLQTAREYCSSDARYSCSEDRGIKAKKVHELRSFLAFIISNCKRHQINRIIDIGCGTGHLARKLSENFEVIGIDCSEVLCKKAMQRYSSSLKIVQLTINGDSANDQNVSKILCGADDARSAVVSLHCCGDLQPNLFKLLTQLPRNRVPLLFSISCCYHKTPLSGLPCKKLLMSEEVKSMVHDDWILPISALRLACQQQVCSWPASIEKRERHKNNFLKRALLQCLYDRKTICLESWARRLNRDFTNLNTVGREFGERLNLKESETDDLSSCYESIILEKSAFFHMIEPFAFLQALIQSPLESFLLCDRFLYLKEQQFSVDIKQIFDPKISPRNFCIVVSTAEELTCD